MTWIKLDDQMPEHPKVHGISDAALGAYVRMLCYSSRFLLDGELPGDVVRRSVKPRIVDELCERGLWRQIISGYLIVNYGKHQRLRAEIEEQRTTERERKRRQRDRVAGTPQLPGVTALSQRDTARSPRGVPQPETETEAEAECENYLLNGTVSAPQAVDNRLVERTLRLAEGAL